MIGSFKISFLQITCSLLLGVIFAASNSSLAQEGPDFVSSLVANVECEDKNQIIPTCLFSRKIPLNSAELISNDLKVCKCLKENNSLFEAFQTAPSDSEKSRIEKQRLLKDHNKKAANLSVIQATGHAQNKKNLDTSLMVYGGQEIRQKTLESIKSQGEIPRDSETKTAPVISSELANLNVIDDNYKDWQCVTYREYSAYRELPLDNNFFLSLKEKTFRPEDWNLNELKKKFDSAPEVEQKSIKLKMIFLSRNPIFQTIFKATPSEKFPASLILTKQTELFNILRTLAPAETSKCYEIPNSCQKEIFSSGAFETYTDKIGNFLIDEAVINISSRIAADEYASELERILQEGTQINQSIPTDPEGYFHYLQTANQELSNSCAGVTAQASCYTKFSEHCRQLHAIDERVRSGIKLTLQDLTSGIREEESVHVILDPALNPDFRSFNDKICLQAFRNTQGEELNFFMYREQKCKGAENDLPECSDRRALLSRFLNEHNVGSEIADINIRSGFNTMISQNRFMDVSLAQIAAANNISESPSELRARFGNEFPSITQTGQLIPFSPASPVSAAPVALSPSPLESRNFDATTNRPNSIPAPRMPMGSPSREPESIVSNGRGSFTSVSPFTNAVTNKLPPANLGTKLNMGLPFNPNLPPKMNLNDGADEVGDSSREVNPPVRERDSIEKTDFFNGTSTDAGNSSSTSSATNSLLSGAMSKSSFGSSGTSSASNMPPSRNGRLKENKLLFKYGLSKNSQSESSLVASGYPEEVVIGVDPNYMRRIKSNPNALEINQQDLVLVMENPDAEVKLVLMASNGEESLVVYAKKDETGGLSYSLNPNKLPASILRPIRIRVSPEVYENTISDPDVFLNQNETLMNEIISVSDNLPEVQIVSKGKRALIFTVRKDRDGLFYFTRRKISNSK
jgi:hypothetical protein